MRKHKKGNFTIVLTEKDNSTQERFDRILGKFKKKIKLSGLLLEYRDKQVFMKPSEKKRKKRLESKRRK
jgi:ribosomal protein S21